MAFSLPLSRERDPSKYLGMRISCFGGDHDIGAISGGSRFKKKRKKKLKKGKLAKADERRGEG